MRVRSLLNLFLVLASVLGVARAHAGVRAEAANRKYICPTNPGEIWLWFDLNGGRVFRRWGDAQFITLKWEGDRVPIWGKEDQDGPFYFERSGTWVRLRWARVPRGREVADRTSEEKGSRRMITRTPIFLIFALLPSFVSAATLRENSAGRVVKCFAVSGNATEYQFNADASRARETFVTGRTNARQAMGTLTVSWRKDRPYGPDGIRLFYAEGGTVQVVEGEDCEFKEPS